MTNEEPVPDAGDVQIIVFTGDSVTDCGRRDEPEGLGNGSVRLLHARLAPTGARVLNRGISGDRSTELLSRWERDVLSEHPTLVSVLIGINDVWARYRNEFAITSPEAFEATYRRLLEPLAEAKVSLALAEPFVVPVDETQSAWFEDLDPKLDVIRRLAGEFGAVLVPLASQLTEQAHVHGAAAIAADGVHPTELGHRLIADSWMAAATAGGVA